MAGKENRVKRQDSRVLSVLALTTCINCGLLPGRVGAKGGF